jgi:hypothetical protein
MAMPFREKFYRLANRNGVALDPLSARRTFLSLFSFLCMTGKGAMKLLLRWLTEPRQVRNGTSFRADNEVAGTAA